MNFFQKSIIFVLSILFSSFSAHADVSTDIKVVTTIKPLHSLISRIMETRGEPQLIIEGTNNPHTFVFKPSHAKMIEEADIVFWIGEDLEAFMEKPLNSLAKDTKKIAFMDSESIEKLKFREENIFDDHDDHDDEHEGHDDHDDHDGHKDDDHDDHDDHDGHDDEHEGHDDHDDHDGHKDDDHDDHDDHDGHDDEHEGHDDHDDHDGHKDDDHDDHDDHDGHDDEHDDHAGHHDGHNHGEFDAHIWLDPENAKEMVKIIRDELIKIDPEGQRQYSVNAAGATLELDNLINNVEKELSKDISYIVFHDAYQYFETRFGVKSAGALTLNPDVLPGAKQIADIQDLISDKGIKCIFSEPQYNPKIIETLGNDMNISTGVMDPLGAFIDAGPTMYVELINGIANSIKDCH
jgi:zinc transport system substrate-binding protein